MNITDKIYIAGHNGLVGSAIHRNLMNNGYDDIIVKNRTEVDLTNSSQVESFFKNSQPEYVFLAAAKVGGIYANNTYPADFIRDNLLIQLNIIDAAYRFKTKKVVFLGSSCIYPKMAAQPIKEEYLLTGDLEPTNDAYAIAKIAGIKMIQAYKRQYGFNGINLMPTNLYGPGDNFDLENSHVLPALLRKFHEAKMNGDSTVTVWGSGKPYREFLYVDDLADAAVYLMQNYDDADIVNVGTGQDVTIAQLADIIKQTVGFNGDIIYDASKPDGTPRKLLDVSKINKLGWKAKISLEEGVKKTYDWYLNQA